MFRFKFIWNRNLMGYKIGPLIEIAYRITSFQISIILTFFADQKRIVMLIGCFNENLELSESNFRWGLSRNNLIIDKEPFLQFLLIIVLEFS